MPLSPRQYLLFLLQYMKSRGDQRMLPSSKKLIMADVTVCDRCKDVGYMMGYKRSLTHDNIQEEWKEVCPYCMPTNKYGNLMKTLEQAPQLLDHKKDDSETKE